MAAHLLTLIEKNDGYTAIDEAVVVEINHLDRGLRLSRCIQGDLKYAFGSRRVSAETTAQAKDRQGALRTPLHFWALDFFWDVGDKGLENSEPKGARPTAACSQGRGATDSALHPQAIAHQ